MPERNSGAAIAAPAVRDAPAQYWNEITPPKDMAAMIAVRSSADEGLSFRPSLGEDVKKLGAQEQEQVGCADQSMRRS
jgi:hypothetical protein